jgi:hypothetical protein
MISRQMINQEIMNIKHSHHDVIVLYKYKKKVMDDSE